MKIFIRAAAILAPVLTLTLSCTDAFSAATNGPVALNYAVTLTDGSTIMCAPQIEIIPVNTTYASLEIPLASIADISFSNETEQASVLHLKNNDVLRGKIALSTIRLKTSFGEIVVDTSLVGVLSCRECDPAPLKDSPEARRQCINNLRMIDAAKDQYALEYGGNENSVFSLKQISTYIKDPGMVVCPLAGGKKTFDECYKINRLSENPDCRLCPTTHRIDYSGP